MRRAPKIGLVLMGGGLAAALFSCDRGDTSACREARAANLPNTDVLCAGSSGHSGSSSGGHGWSWSSGGSARGGFGGTAHASAGG